MSASKKELEELAESWKSKFKTLEERIGEVSSRPSENPNSQSEEGDNVATIYKCRGKDCAFSTDNIEDYVHHVTDERIAKAIEKIPHSASVPPEEEAIKRPHRSVKEIMACPECKPKFEDAFKSLGWTPPAPTPKGEAKEKKGVVDLP